MSVNGELYGNYSSDRRLCKLQELTGGLSQDRTITLQMTSPREFVRSYQPAACPV